MATLPQDFEMLCNSSSDCEQEEGELGKDDFETLKAKLESQIVSVRCARNLDRQKHLIAMDVLSLKLKELVKLFNQRFKAFLRDTSVRLYSPYMKSQDTPTYLLILQATVLRNLHQMCVVEEQKNLVEKQSNHAIARLRQTIVQLGDEKTQLEVSMLNAMAKIHAEEQAMHESYASVLSQQTEHIGHLQDTINESDVERLIDEELDVLIESIALDGVAKLKDAAPKRSHVPTRGTRPLQYSPVLQRKATKKSLSLGEMLTIGDKEKQQTSFHTSITENSDDASSTTFSVKMSQSFTNLIWKEKRNKVVSI